MPLPPTELRLAVPLDEHEASYLAASASTASLRWTVCREEDEFELNTVLIYSVLIFRATGALYNSISAAKGAWSDKCDQGLCGNTTGLWPMALRT